MWPGAVRPQHIVSLERAHNREMSLHSDSPELACDGSNFLLTPGIPFSPLHYHYIWRVTASSMCLERVGRKRLSASEGSV